MVEDLENANAKIAELEEEVSRYLQLLDNRIDSLDLEAIRDRTLNKLKVGKQSTAGKAIDTFIKELRRE